MCKIFSTIGCHGNSELLQKVSLTNAKLASTKKQKTAFLLLLLFLQIKS